MKKQLLDRKGNTELVLTAIILSATLMIIIVGYIITKQSVSAEVSINADSRAHEFNSMAALNTVFQYKDNHRKLIEFNHPPSGSKVDENQLENQLGSSLSYLKDTSITGYSGKYIIKMENDNNKILANESKGGTFFQSKAYVASPKKNESTLTVRINEE